MPSGRPPVPDEILKSRGTYRKDRHGSRLQSDGNRPECPKRFKGESKKKWKWMVDQLSRLKILDSIDANYIAFYVKVEVKLDAVERATDDLYEKLAEVDEDQSAEIQKRIWRLEISWARLGNLLIKYGDRLGVGAAARARVKAEKGPVEPTGGKARFFGTVG